MGAFVVLEGGDLYDEQPLVLQHLDGIAEEGDCIEDLHRPCPAVGEQAVLVFQKIKSTVVHFHSHAGSIAVAQKGILLQNHQRPVGVETLQFPGGCGLFVFVKDLQLPGALHNQVIDGRAGLLGGEGQGCQEQQ